MPRLLVLAALTIAVSGSAHAAPRPALRLSPELQPLSFLVGHWATDKSGKTASGTTSGRSAFSIETGGATLLRRDHSRLKGADGKPAGEMDQIMLIYSEGGHLRADYSDGVHVIHYAKVEVKPGRSVVFGAEGPVGAPRFQLAYDLTSVDHLSVRFLGAAPGQAEYASIAEGVLIRKPPRTRHGKARATAAAQASTPAQP